MRSSIKRPAPDVYQLALERLSLSGSADDCVAFVNSQNGFLSAKAAGMRIIVSPCPGIYTEDQVFECASDIFPDSQARKEITTTFSERSP